MQSLKKIKLKQGGLLIKIWTSYLFFLVISTEILSLFNLITRKAVLSLYALFVVLGLLFIYKKVGSTSKKKIKIRKIKISHWYVLLALMVLLPLFLIALYYPPINWDSMTYHLPRVEEWLQNHNVNFYPVHNSRQLFLPPLAEYVILHFRLLTNSDIYSNFVQYISMIMSTVVAVEVSKELKGNKQSQILSAILVATIPMGIMQSTSTQNDYMSAYLLISALYFCLSENFIYLFITFGLGLLTKLTFAIFFIPFGIYFGITWLKKYGLVRMLRTAFFLIFFVFVVNGPQWLRNYEYYGSFTGDRDQVASAFNQNHKPKYILSNIFRNIGLQLGLPNEKYNIIIDKAELNIHKFLGLDLNEKSVTFLDTSYKTIFGIHEDVIGNFIISILIALSFLLVLRVSKTITLLYCSLISGFFLFSFVLKWQPWHSRLLLPFFVVASPIVAMIFERLLKNKILFVALSSILLISSIPFVFRVLPNFLGGKSLVWRLEFPNLKFMKKSRDDRFLSYHDNGEIIRSYYNITNEIRHRNIKSIGLDLGYDTWEYPLWFFLNDEKLAARITHIRTSKISIPSDLNQNVKYDAFVTDRKWSKKEEDDRGIIYVKNYGSLWLMIHKE